MQRKQIVKKYSYYIVIAFAFVGILLVILFWFNKTKDVLKNELLQYSTSFYNETIKNILDVALENTNSPEEFFSKKTKNNLTRFFRILNYEHGKAPFIIYKDNEGIYRFFLDTSVEGIIEGSIYIPIPEEEQILNDIFSSEKPKDYYIIKQEIVKGVSSTLIKPIKIKNKVVAVLFFDFITTFSKFMNDFIQTVNRIIIVSMILAFLGAIYSVITMFVSYSRHKKTFVDELTGVYNRNYLEEFLYSIDLNRYAVAMVDIDFFKKVNDTYGHIAGDTILKEFAKLLKKYLRKEDIIVRYGGEEFLILLRKTGHKSDILTPFFRLRDILKEHKFKIAKDTYIKITFSAGVFIETENEKSLIEAIKKADLSLYKAKLNGRNRIEIYKKDKQSVSIFELTELIEEGYLICHYQPVYNLKTNDVEYFEALARLKTKEGKTLFPNEFLPVIENSFLASKFAKAVVDFNINVLEKYQDISVSINLLPSDLLNEAIVHHLLNLEENLVSRIKIEIVETESIKQKEKLFDNIKKLREKGYSFCIDDFGSGYSNFDYLFYLDTDYIKIDANIIRNILSNKKAFHIANSIVEFAKREGIKSVAEFIDNQDILDKVKSMGVDYGQGYFLRKPDIIENLV